MLLGLLIFIFGYAVGNYFKDHFFYSQIAQIRLSYYEQGDMARGDVLMELEEELRD